MKKPSVKISFGFKICRDTRFTDAYAYGFSVCLFASVIKMSKLIFATLGSALLPLNSSRRLVGHVVPQAAGTFGFELAPETCEHSLVDFGEVCRHGFGGVHRAHHDAGLVCRAERNENHRHLPNLFVQVVSLQEFGADVVELAERIEVFAGGELFDKFRVFVGHATDLVNYAVDCLETVGKFRRELPSS